LIPAADLVEGGVAGRVVEILVAHGPAEIEPLGRVPGQFAIDAVVVAADIGLVFRPEPRRGLRAGRQGLARERLARRTDVVALDPARFVPLLDRVVLPAVLQAEGHLQLAGVLEREAARHIQRIDPLGRRQLSDVEMTRTARPQAGVQAVVLPVRNVRAVTRRQIPIPAGQTATGAEDRLIVLVLDDGQGAQAVRRELGQYGA